MHTTYQTEVHEKRVGNTVIAVTNSTPIYHREEKADVRAKIEGRLYEVFSKYVSHQS